MADLFQRILMIKKSTLFGGINTEDLTVVANEFEEELFFSGDTIFSMGDMGDRMYVVEEGEVGISIQSNGGSKKEFISVLGAGECFGEMGLLDDKPRSASAYVLKDSRILSLEKERLKGLIIHYPELSFGIMKGLCERLRSANELISR